MAADNHARNVSALVDRSNLHVLTFAYLALLAAVAGLITGIALFGQGSEGEPVVRAAIASIRSPNPVSIKRVTLAPKPVAQKSATATVPSTQEQTSSGASAAPAAPSLPTRIARSIYAGSALIADPALVEETVAGPLPRIADDGRTPMMAYAPPVAATKAPRIAIVIGGLGISAKATALAISELPPGITLAFSPYDTDVQRWVSEARKRGHEVLMEVPMEPYDFPDSDPGPHTLRTGVSEDSNIERLTWSLTRFSGYAGITNLLGERFLADRKSLEPVMNFVTRRGLFFFDSSEGPRSEAPALASQMKTPFIQSTVTIDAIQTGMEIDQRLSELETRARATRIAAGSGFIYPVTVVRIKAWAEGLASRGFVLAPASAIVRPAK